MSVIVLGMKMPKDCTECRFAYDGRCFANYGRKSKIDITNYCPLIELEDGVLFGEKNGQVYKAKMSTPSGKTITVIREEVSE